MGLEGKNLSFLKKGGIKSKVSKGLKLSEDRIKLLQEIYGKNTTVEIIDLDNPNGTVVLIQLPVSD